jgi:hypothetical protein
MSFGKKKIRKNHPYARVNLRQSVIDSGVSVVLNKKSKAKKYRLKRI